jgi:hypothetical protein
LDTLAGILKRLFANWEKAAPIAKLVRIVPQPLLEGEVSEAVRDEHRAQDRNATPECRYPYQSDQEPAENDAKMHEVPSTAFLTI